MKTMIFALSTCLILSLQGTSQDSNSTFALMVNWPLGTQIHVTTLEWSEELKNEKFVTEDSTAFEFDISVIGDHSEFLEIEYAIDDPLHAATAEWTSDWDANQKISERMTLHCQINKNSAELHIPKWQELSKIATEKYKRVLEALSGRDGEMAGYFHLIFDQHIKAMETEEGIISLYAKDLSLLLRPYGKTYSKDKPIVIETEDVNPFNSKEKVNVIEKFTLLPNSTPSQHHIEYHIEFDMQKTMQLMREMIEKMNAALASSPEAAEKKLKELDAIKIEMTNESVFKINANTTLPLDVTFKMEMDGFDGKKNRTTRKYKQYKIAISN